MLGDALPWLGCYLDPLPIRSRGAFHLASAKRAADGRACVVVVPSPSADLRRVNKAFDEIERVHALLDHPSIPKVAARSEAGGVPFLEFACDGRIDGVDVLRLLSESNERMSYGQGDACIFHIRRVLGSAHAVIDPTTGSPICIGRLSYGNVLFSAKGEMYLVGFGHNFPIERDTGAIEGWCTCFQAAELSAGGSPSPSGDYVALIMFMRTLMPYIKPPEALARIYRGDIQPGDSELVEHLQWYDRRMLSQMARQRATIEEAVAVSARLRTLLGVTLDLEGFAACIAAHLNLDEQPAPDEHGQPAAARTLALATDAAWVAGEDGTRHRLGRGMRRIVAALVAHHERAPGTPMAMWNLFEAGWPGEQPAFEVGANRVYVALTRLRAMGLRDIIERFEDGYRLAPNTLVVKTDT
jgi:hypothetical protein